MTGPHDTDRLRFEPLTADHLDLMVELTRDPEVMRYITGGRPVERDEMIRVIGNVHDHRWLAHLHDDDVLVGWVSLRPDVDDPSVRELGYRFRRSFWGRGLATEAALATVAHAFRDLGCDRVWAQAMAVNTRSRAVMVRGGLRYVRTVHLPWDEPIDGNEHGDVIYEVTRAVWSAGQDGAVVAIRPGRVDDGPVLQEIELSAGTRFREIEMGSVADADPSTLDELAAYVTGGRCWVAVEEGGEDDGTAVGYVVVDEIDGNAHIEQVSVVVDHQGLGIGKRLIDHVDGWAAATGRPALTLTTFTDVPWNGPLYAHLGFRALTEAELGPQLRAVRNAETAHGLDPTSRICMRREVPAPA